MSFAARQATCQTATNENTYYDTITVYYNNTSKLKNEFIPDSVFQLYNLIELSIQGMDCDYRLSDENGNDITECWMISEIPLQIKNLKKLEQLRLNVNAITKIPKEIVELKNLKSIDLNDNMGLSDISYLMKLENLEELGLYGCGLTKLPPNIGELHKLKYLGLSGNQIDSIELNRIKKALPNCKIYFE